MGRFTLPVLVTLAFSCLPSSKAAAEQSLPELFDLACRLEGHPYALARDRIVAGGKAGMAFIEKESQSQDWRRRLLALACMARIRDPEGVKRRLSPFYKWEYQSRMDFSLDRVVEVWVDPKKPGSCFLTPVPVPVPTPTPMPTTQ